MSETEEKTGKNSEFNQEEMKEYLSGTEKPDPDTGMGLEIYEWIQCFVTALVVGILIFTFIGRVVRVDGSSMYQTLQDGDLVLASNLFYTPENGDIIVLQTNSYGSSALVKRIIATEGQTVDIDFDAGIVYVDGEAIEETYTNTPTNLRQDFYGPVTVPEGCVFVMGDNRNVSLDSRNSLVGMVDERCIVGKVYFILFPGVGYNDFGLSTGRDYSRIGSPY